MRKSIYDKLTRLAKKFTTILLGQEIPLVLSGGLCGYSTDYSLLAQEYGHTVSHYYYC